MQRRRRDIRNWLGADTPFPERDSTERTYQMAPEYVKLFEDVVDYCRESVSGGQGLRQHQQRVRYWAALAILRCVLSSPAAASAVLENRHARTQGVVLSQEEEPDPDEIFRNQVFDSSEEEQPPDYIPTAPADSLTMNGLPVRWAGRWRHLLFGLFLLVIGAPTLVDPANFDFSLVGNQGLVVGMFLASFLFYGIPLAWLVDAFERRFPRVNPHHPERCVAGCMVVMGLGVPFLLLFVLILFVKSVCGCEPNYITGVFLIGLGVTTITAWAGQLTTDLQWRLTSVAKTAAYFLFVGAGAAGAVRTGSDISAIL